MSILVHKKTSLDSREDRCYGNAQGCPTAGHDAGKPQDGACPKGSVPSQAAEAGCMSQRLRRWIASPPRVPAQGLTAPKRAAAMISLNFGQDIAGDNPPAGRSILSERTF
ncbi:hypothetical protein WJ0W_000444 [Paenibacillus melissococcoides]|uniref:Uncharacterized protein n=1 Tax=Paenibacillus melissococcoides TaxID=2912268 RepID=A0ABN8TWX6_9BACL|nr:hypothetical protein WJ0W_000444 [Paenibacillus melissococcoides]